MAMSVNRQVLGILGVIALAAGLVARPAAAQDWNVTPPPEGEVEADFDAALAPYGDWVDVNGNRAWRPAATVVGDDFQPYATAGQWLYSDYGWYFQSEYPWGWAPFHYGRWALDPTYGWVWLPGQTWAPAWVDWRIGGGYIGWAPLPPIGWSVVVQPWRPYWCFVPGAYFPGNYYAYRLPVERIHYAYAATAPVHQAVAYGGARWYAGPPLAHVERNSTQPVPRVTGMLTPPAPGRVQAVHLQPPRSYSGSLVAPRRASAGGNPASPRPGTVAPTRPYQAPSPASSPAPSTAPRSADPGRGASPAPPTPRPVPHGSNVRPPSTPSWSGARASSNVRPPSTPSWSGATASAFATPRGSIPSFSAPRVSAGGGSHSGVPAGGRGGHAGRR